MMVTYLLLRDNKEKGPYSFEELVSLGLKPYDLIWVQGKSAAWRYPSEIPDLAPHAPVIEEQPYDRFYKKEESKEADAQKQIFTPPVLPDKEQETELHDAYKPKPSVFVTMPAAAKKPAEKVIEQTPAVVPAEPVASQPTITISENPEAAKIKYSQPLDEIKEMYVKTLQDRRQKLAFRSVAIQSLKKASVILLFVSAGVIAGFMIKTKKDSAAIVQSSSLTEPKQEVLPFVQNADPSEVIEQHAGDEFLANSNTELPVSSENNSKTQEGKIPARQHTRPQATELLSSETTTPGEKDIKANYEFRSTEVDPGSGERIRKTRETDISEKRSGTALVADPAPRLSKKSGVATQVSVKANEYRVVAFGGIRDLQLTVTNDSKFPLDEVVVELEYLKPSEQPLRTDNIRFKSIAPNTSSTLRIPDTNRGIKVNYRILKVTSEAAEDAGM